MSDLEVGQYIWLRARFNNSGLISTTEHPYLVVAVDPDMDVVEVAQLDSLAGKEHKAARRCNKVIYCDNPRETVTSIDGYAQLDNTFKLENYPELSGYRKTTDKLSAIKLKGVIDAYVDYHEHYEIDEDKQIFMDRAEIEALNPKGAVA